MPSRTSKKRSSSSRRDTDLAKKRKPGELQGPQQTPDQLLLPCEKAKALREIFAEQKIILDISQQIERLQQVKATKDKSVAVARDAFNAKYPAPVGVQDYLVKQEDIWGHLVGSRFWWATDGFLKSLNELPRELLEEILLCLGAVQQARLRR